LALVQLAQLRNLVEGGELGLLICCQWVCLKDVLKLSGVIVVILDDAQLIRQLIY
jgi:hypothetical protein